METAVQFSIFLVNKPGVLSQIFSELAKAKINVIAIAMMDSQEHGVLRMVVDDPKPARAVLKKLNVQVAEAELLAVTLPSSAQGWTPSLDQCLEVGGRYAWSVRAGDAWSEASLFRVATGPSTAEVREALETLQRFRHVRPRV